MNYVIGMELKNVPWDASPVPSSMNYMVNGVIRTHYWLYECASPRTLSRGPLHCGEIFIVMVSS